MYRGINQKSDCESIPIYVKKIYAESDLGFVRVLKFVCVFGLLEIIFLPIYFTLDNKFEFKYLFFLLPIIFLGFGLILIEREIGINKKIIKDHK